MDTPLRGYRAPANLAVRPAKTMQFVARVTPQDISPTTSIAIRLFDPGTDRLGTGFELLRQLPDAFPARRRATI